MLTTTISTTTELVLAIALTIAIWMTFVIVVACVFDFVRSRRTPQEREQAFQRGERIWDHE